MEATIANAAEAASIQLATAAESENIIVSTAATAAQYALNLAMSLNPISIVVLALASFISALIIYTSYSKLAAERQGEFNALLDQTGDLLDAEIKGFNEFTSARTAESQSRQRQESALQQLQIDNLLKIQNTRQEANDKNENFIKEIEDKGADASKQETINLGLAYETRTKLDEAYTQGRLDLQNLEVQKQAEIQKEQLQDQQSFADASLALTAKNSAENFAAQRVAATTAAAVQINDAGTNAAKIAQIQADLSARLSISTNRKTKRLRIIKFPGRKPRFQRLWI